MTITEVRLILPVLLLLPALSLSASQRWPDAGERRAAGAADGDDRATGHGPWRPAQQLLVLLAGGALVLYLGIAVQAADPADAGLRAGDGALQDALAALASGP